MFLKFAFVSMLALSFSLRAAEPTVVVKLKLSKAEHRYFNSRDPEIANDFSRDLTTSFEAHVFGTRKVVTRTSKDSQGRVYETKSSSYDFSQSLDVAEQKGSIRPNGEVNVAFKLDELKAFRGRRGSLVLSYTNNLGTTPNDMAGINLGYAEIQVDKLLGALEKNDAIELPFKGEVDVSESTLWPGLEARTEGKVTIRIEK